MNSALRVSLVLAAVSLLPLSAFGQRGGISSPQNNSEDLTTGRNVNNQYNLVQKHCVIGGRVMMLNGDPIADAKVEVSATAVGGQYRYVMTDFRGEFQTEYWLNAKLVTEYTVDLRVSKAGFRKAHALIDFGPAEESRTVPVTLRPMEEDADLLPQADLIAPLAPRLSKLQASDGLSAEGEKDYARGVAEFLDQKRPDKAEPFFGKVARRDAACLACRTMLALAELDASDWDGAYRNLGEVINNILKDPSLGRPEPFVAFGVMESWRHQPKNAAGYFVEALKFRPQDPLALQELGRSQLLIQNWGAAAEYLNKAILAGASPEVRILRVRALLGEDQVQEASAEMTRYLNGRDVKKMPVRVRQLWAQVEDRKKVEEAYVKAKAKRDAIDYVHRTPSDLRGLEPATDQKQLDSILGAVGKTVAEFFGNFPNTSSLEQIHQERMNKKKKVGARNDQTFRYLCFTPAAAWGPGFVEYRADLAGKRGVPQGLEDGFMLTAGFASASLVFHPIYQSQAVFRYVGRQKINGRDTYVIAYAQDPTKSRLNGTFESTEKRMTVFSQGLAWIDSQTYQITRLRTDLLKPLPEVKLERQTTEIVFGEVQFTGLASGFWVPQQVTVTVDWNGRHFRNEHSYSGFKRFNVEATEKVREVGQAPKQEAPGSDVTR